MYINTISKKDLHLIHKFFSDKLIAASLYSHIQEIYHSEISKQYIYTMSVENDHFYIMIQSLNRWQQQRPVDDTGSTFLMRVTKRFPLEGVRLFALNHYLHPRITDGRDLVQQLLGQKQWNHKRRLIQLIKGIQNFQQRLKLRHESYLSVQMTGRFRMNDLFSMKQLSKFSALDLFIDFSEQKKNKIVGVSETHILILKKYQKDNKKEQNYQMIKAFDMQCINKISHDYKSGQIILGVTKYKINSNFNQYQISQKKYTLKNSSIFIKKVLEQIWKFQKIDISFHSSSVWHSQKGFNEIYPIIEGSKKLEDELKKTKISDKQNIVKQLSHKFHAIIDYFSESGQPYYLVYVHKLNSLFQSNNIQNI